MANGADQSGKGVSIWMSHNPGKRWTEVFFLLYSPVWITWALLVIVPFGLYHRFKELEYMCVGLAAGLPCILIPPLLPQPPCERQTPWYNRYWFKANVWIAIFSFVGNYFWTHYFFKLLGAAYTFPSWTLNSIPICLYLLTHAYFCLYHTLSNLFIRRIGRGLDSILPSGSTFAKMFKGICIAAWVAAFAYFTAFMETLTIANFDYYTFIDKDAMYRVGSLFYAIYFFVSFPLFFRMEENTADPKWNLGTVVMDSLGASMLVTILLDFWRLAIGPIVNLPSSMEPSSCASGLATVDSIVWM